METNDVLGTLAIFLSVLLLIYLVAGKGKKQEKSGEQINHAEKKIEKHKRNHA